MISEATGTAPFCPKRPVKRLAAEEIAEAVAQLVDEAIAQRAGELLEALAQALPRFPAAAEVLHQAGHCLAAVDQPVEGRSLDDLAEDRRRHPAERVARLGVVYAS